MATPATPASAPATPAAPHKPSNALASGPTHKPSNALTSNKPLPATPNQTQAQPNKPLPATPTQTQAQPNKPLPATPTQAQAQPSKPLPATPTQAQGQNHAQEHSPERLTAAALDSQGHPNTAGLDTLHHSKSESHAPNQLSLHDNAVTVGSVGEYKLAGKQEGTSKTEHKVGTTEHKLPGDASYQHASAGLTHTQGNGTQGIHHQQVNAHASLGRVKQEGTYSSDRLKQHGVDAEVKTEGNAALLHAEGEAGMRLNSNPGQRQAIMYVNGKALSGVHGIATGHLGNQHLSVTGRGEGRAGAFVEGQAGVVVDQKKGDAFAQARISALAGAEGKVQGQAKMGPFIVYGGVGGKAGLGYEANVGAGMQNGVMKAQAEVGGAFGLGGSAMAGAGFDTHWARENRPHRPQWAHFRSANRHPQAPAQATA